ncbi:MAG: hypothetical protein UY07_C0004G0004 [Parcubacteria group bacterium GW2011_GWA1_47_8]|nr:MAG: hypothetical protein UY07_C0004G0004 [Parcubacteria group bacterium GW2011_GWA1_47_8]
MKKVIILEHGGGELANQLWNFASIYAYCKEKGFECQNYSFFEYAQYFNIPPSNRFIDFFFLKPFQNYHRRRSTLKTKLWRSIYKVYARSIAFFHKKQIVSSVNPRGEKYSLPPTKENTVLTALEQSNDVLYFTGWLFRNPRGLEKYQKEIASFLKPKKRYTEPAEKRIRSARNTYQHIVGVHIRQTDYRTHKSGEYYISPERVVVILNEYLFHLNKTPQDTLFIVTSDEPISEEIFIGLNIVTNNGNAIEDLYALSLCDVIIGSNSSFGNFAAYYGNKPHIILQKGAVDWEYYKNKSSYFEDKYSVMFN